MDLRRPTAQCVSLVNLSDLMAGGFSQCDLVSMLERSPEQQDELDGLIKARKDASTRLAELAVAASTREVAPREEIQAALPAHAAILTWVDVSDHSGKVQEHFVCIVRSGGEPKWVRLPGTGPDGTWTKDDTALPAKLRQALAGSDPAVLVERFAKQLHAQRIAPALPHLDGVKTLYCVPVNEMAGIPIEALTQDFTISYVPSGSYLAKLKNTPVPTGNRLLALGDAIYELEKTKPSEALPPGGLLITQVLPKSAGANANLRPGDVLISYGGTTLKDLDSLKEAIAANEKKTGIPVRYWNERTASVVETQIEPGRLGVVLDPAPAPEAIASRRKTEAMLASLRGGEWNDLPGTRVETSRLQQLFGNTATILTDSDASEQSLETLRKSGELSKFRYLHFASHGEGNNTTAFESALILSQDKLPKDLLPKPGEPFLNGQLSAREVLEFWKLNANLVTLSACETAIGKAGVKPGFSYGKTDEYGIKAVEGRMHTNDLYATLLALMGHKKLTYRYAGRDFRLTDVKGEVVREIMA